MPSCTPPPSRRTTAPPAIPFDDFDTNAVGTLNLLEAARRACPESPFVHMSTNKVYGDRPNTIALREEETRWDYADPAFAHGIAEDFPIDQSKHSLFGASKLAADIMVQEYGRYFGMPTCCLRGGCLTGPNHSGVELHGFLSYLVKCNLEGREYQIHGYKGKQVRDNIHSQDVARFIWEFVKAPRVAEVYNLGGGKDNSCSILEAFQIAESFSGKAQKFTYRRDPPHRRPHLLLQRPAQDARPFPAVGHHHFPDRNDPADRRVLARPPAKSMKLLITGICGFAGSVLARTLLEQRPDLRITGIDNLSRKGSETNVEPLRKLGIDVRIGDVRAPAFRQACRPPTSSSTAPPIPACSPGWMEPPAASA
jgi:nucleoside-diphosphate-sugar epimerase